MLKLIFFYLEPTNPFLKPKSLEDDESDLQRKSMEILFLYIEIKSINIHPYIS